MCPGLHVASVRPNTDHCLATPPAPTHLQGEQHGQELSLVPDQHGIADDGQLHFHSLFDGQRGNVLPTGGDD
jgi:hypothetical protein